MIPLGLQIALYGVALAWLVALLPAGVVTCLKGQWLFFGTGWLTGGLLWFVGAASTAQADSFWANRFYDEEKLSSIRAPLRHARSWRSVGVTTAVVLATIVALGVFGTRPFPILGLNGQTLENSVGNSPRLIGIARPCDQFTGGDWTCYRWDNQVSSTVAYRVHVNGLGCWHAVRTGFPGERGSPERLSGCVRLLDYL